MDANMIIAQFLQEAGTHATWAAAICYALQVLKKSQRLRFISDDTKALNAWLSFGAALAVGIGITATGDATHGYTIGIPPLATLLSSGIDAGKQWVANQFFYDRFVQPSGTAAGPVKP